MSGYLERFAAAMRANVPMPERESSEISLRTNVLQLVEGAVRRRRLQRQLAVAASACLAITGAWATIRVTRSSGEHAIEYQVAGTLRSAPIGQYVAPTTNAPLSLKFSEGSVVELEPGARARVARTTTHGATVLLETGEARVDVVHRPVTDWTVLAGPYTVHVTGTAFNVNFESGSQRFELLMKSGVVNIEGPGLLQPVQVKADERFVHYVGDQKFEHRNVSGSDVHHSSDSTANKTDGDQPSGESPKSGRHQPNRPTKAVGQPEWAAEVARGEYASVLRQAEERGWSSVLAGATSAELMAVANAARFLGKTGSSRGALEAVRSRFKGTTSASSAAYLLGRLSEPNSPREALSWYSQYEREAPGGALVAEAAGRRLLLVQASGDRASADKLARDYIGRFPDGPYAGVARKIAAP